MLSGIVVAIESFVGSLPLSLLESWGRGAFGVGLVLALVAFGGFTFRPAGRWGFGRERQAWDARAVLSVSVTFVLTMVTGYVGSFIVLVPGAQTLESLKDLVVFLCIVLFGYPALLTVPFAYGLSDLIEGVPPDLLLAWLPGYFINPACFWIAYQLIGRDPDFRRLTTWRRYAAFVLLFTAIEPVLWGYICSGAFGPEISYRAITSALLFTTAITWVLSPFAMLAALPAARRLGFFWADIPDHVEERVWREVRRPVDGVRRRAPPLTARRQGWPIRVILAAPFVLLVMLMVGVTAYVTLRSAEADTDRLVTRLHEEISDNIRFRLDALAPRIEGADGAAVSAMLAGLPIAQGGVALIIDASGRRVAASVPWSDAVAQAAIARVVELAAGGTTFTDGARFEVTLVTERPLSRATWIGLATSYGGEATPRPSDLLVVSLAPESYHLAGAQAGSRRSALVFGLALLTSLALAAGIASLVTRDLRRITEATASLTAGDLGASVPASRVVELHALGRSFNDMARRLQGTIDDLEEREAFLRITQDAAGVGNWEWDLSGPLERVRWSEQLARMHGITSSEFDGAPETVLQLCHPDDRAQLRDVMRTMRSGEPPGAFEYRVPTRGGGTRDLWFLGQVTTDERGMATKVLGVSLDITERKRMEYLLASETRVMGLIAADAPLAEVLATVCSVFETMRPETLASVLLLDADGVHVRHGAAPNLPQAYWAAIEGAPIGPKAGSCGTAAYRRQAVIVVDIDTDPLWDDYRSLAQAHDLRACWSTPILDVSGGVMGTFAMYYRKPRSPSADDLRLIARATRLAGLAIQRQRAREEIRAHEYQLVQEKRFVDTLMDSLPGVVILFDATGRLIKWNQVLENVTGYSSYDLEAMSALDLVSPVDAAAIDDAVRATLVGGQHSVEAHIVTRAGQAIPYYFTGVSMRLEGRSLTLGIGLDISDRRRLEEQFQQAQKMEAMGHLAAGVAHDFNNLLTVICGHAQILLLDPPASQDEQESLEAIRDAGVRAASLTRQLLSFSRKSVLQPKVLDLNAEVRDTERMLTRVLGEQVELRTALAPDLGRVEVDPGQLSQVLMNLTVNARDAMPGGGMLTVATRNAVVDQQYCLRHPGATPGSYVVLSVGDSGTGMSREVLARIFEPFFTTKGVGKGTGLGLAMVQSVVEQSGGHIDVITEVGKGTTFDIYFPAVDAALDAADAHLDTRSEGRGTETVLLVEDDPDVRALSLRALRSRGYTVIVATDGTDALKLSEAHRGKIDLVVTDVVMAGLSGRETVDLLRHSRGDVCVLYVSGYTDDAILRHGVLNKEVDFLPKPFTPAELARKVRDVLDTRRGGRARP